MALVAELLQVVNLLVLESFQAAVVASTLEVKPLAAELLQAGDVVGTFQAVSLSEDEQVLEETAEVAVVGPMVA